MKKFVLPRLALLGSAAALVLAACASEGPVASVAGPRLLPPAISAVYGTVEGGKIEVCIDPASAPGNYTISVVVTYSVASPGDEVVTASIPLASGGCGNVVVRNLSRTISHPTTVTVTASTNPEVAGTFTYMCTSQFVGYCDGGIGLSSSGLNGASASVDDKNGSDVKFLLTGSGSGNPDIATPLFVIGDQQPHASTNVVNFWGAQWWKNNPTSGIDDKGVASFKGYATSSANVCGGRWISRVGNSPPPPATLGTGPITIIVTSAVEKIGPDIGGVIFKIITVTPLPGYGPNPGHAGNGTVTVVNCS